MLQGVITAIITPFNDDGSLNEDGLQENVRYQLLHNINGIVVLGTTGESPTLTEEEKKRTLEIVISEVDKRIPVIVGTGCNSTQRTVEATKRAKDMGADAALIITPYYNRPTQEGVFQHFRAAASVGLPIIIYNHPGRTGQPISLKTLQRLSTIPAIAGIKECSGSLQLLSEIYETICRPRPDFCLLTGDDPMILPSMALGAHGVISVASNLIPNEIISLVEALNNGDCATARTIHYNLQELLRVLFIETNPIPLKAAMAIAGMASGPCRLPLCDLQDDNKEQLVKVLKKVNLDFTYAARSLV